MTQRYTSSCPPSSAKAAEKIAEPTNSQHTIAGSQSSSRLQRLTAGSRAWRSACRQPQASEGLLDHRLLKNRCDEPQFTAAVWAGLQVEIEHLREQLGPTQPHRPVGRTVRLAFGRRCGLGCRLRVLRHQQRALLGGQCQHAVVRAVKSCGHPTDQVQTRAGHRKGPLDGVALQSSIGKRDLGAGAQADRLRLADQPVRQLPPFAPSGVTARCRPPPS